MELHFEKIMITSEPFKAPAIRRVIDHYINKRMYATNGDAVMVDPFARSSFTTTYPNFITNDLNPEFDTKYNLEFKDFAKEMELDCRRFDLMLFDPPYNLSQLKLQYDNIGHDLELWQTQRPWTDGKNMFAKMMKPNSYVISFGWSTFGMGVRRGFEKVAIYNFEQYGGDKGRYNLLMTVERKVPTLEDFK